MTTTTASRNDSIRPDADRTDLARLAPATAADPAEQGLPVVYWPDPSGLEQWWTEVMDGALLPAPGVGPVPLPAPPAQRPIRGGGIGGFATT
ncbi:hypothetical protein [Nocardia vaccinii]|uniref:hypothetical protein n=1 Tax=Nocardia vaccinii TaxID=1822 RepID=UPI00082CD014|nr:hypothetical protein [Nocardia vaccinii]